MIISRDERQLQCIKRWRKNNGIGTVCACTGFGKTRIAINTIKRLINADPNITVLISVPTDVLKEQWMEQLVSNDILSNCKVEIINSIIKRTWDVDLLVIDEIHLTASNLMRSIFDVVDYQFILGLTATLERLDGKEVIIKKHCPVIDEITIDLATENGWVSTVKEYVVLLDVDLTEYNEWNRKFNGFFAYFDYDFNLAMKCATDAIYRNKYAKQFKLSVKEIAGVAYGWMQCMKNRKSFVMSHPKKIEIARKILDARQDKKCITFSATIKDSEKLAKKGEYVLHSKQSKKQNMNVMDNFNKVSAGVLHSSKAADCGVDIKGLSVGIILSTDSSKIRKTQRVGRIIRFEEGKTAELFTIVIKGTQEVYWFQNSATSNYTIINETQLDSILNGESINTRQRENVKNTKFRF